MVTPVLPKPIGFWAIVLIIVLASLLVSLFTSALTSPANALLASPSKGANTAAVNMAGPFTPNAAQNEAPFGDAVSPNIKNYTRAAPFVGTAGKLTSDGVKEAQDLGFKLIIDIRQPTEGGVKEEQAQAATLGLAYQNIPFAKDETAWRQVEEIEALLAESSNYPVLIHCGSANRVGAFWALYRYRPGVPAQIAIEEGRAIGLKSREAQTRALLKFDQ